MNDRELLEYAAKAEGREIQYMTLLNGDKSEVFIACWNPLTDDGDALRLAVKIGYKIVWDDVYEEVEVHFGDGSDKNEFIIEAYKGDKFKATKYAIVRAAAEIGKAKS